MIKEKGEKAERNRTLTLDSDESEILESRLIRLSAPAATLNDVTIHQDAFEALDFLPQNSFDMLFADPPYNLTKTFGENRFDQLSSEDYEKWLDSWLTKCVRLLKQNASVYICGDWRSGSAIQRVASRYFRIRNRITWEREKGRGALSNWKNASEDIWFLTVSDDYTFNLEDVRLKRRVTAPYRENGRPKDWVGERDGNFRLTSPSNLWNDITVPFWSMPENTEHPTQKPEKLLAKIILASTNPGDLILDPFLGSGTTSVVARKLGRHFVGIESDEKYALLAEKRISLAETNPKIQGYADGVFWERNSLVMQKQTKKEI